MGSGMGQPSVGIYSYDSLSNMSKALFVLPLVALFKKDVHLRDIIIVQGACAIAPFASV